MKSICGYLKKVKIYVLFYSLSKIINRISTLAIPMLTKEIIDNLNLAENMQIINYYGVLLLLTTIIFVASLSTEYYFKSMGEFKIEMILKDEIFKSLISKKYGTEKSIGAVIQRFTADIEKCKSLLVTTIVDVLVDIIYMISVFVLMFKMNIMLSISLALVFVVVFIINKFYLPHISNITNKFYKNEEAYTSEIESSYSGQLAIKAFNAHIYAINKVQLVVAKLSKNKRQILKLECLVDYFGITGLMNLAPVLIYWLGGQLVSNQMLTIGDLVAFSLLFSKIWNPIERLLEAPKKIKLKKLSFDRIREITNYERMNRGNQLELFEKLEVKALAKAYKEKIIFSDFSLEIEKGDKIWLKGDNGAGKSTILKIITQLESYQDGKISINDKLLEEWDEVSVRNKIIYIPQEAYVFSNETDENIYLNFNHKVQFNFDIEKKNQSDNFSMGERKIMQIMRGINLDADFYIFDEPLAFIDEKSKKIIMDLINNKLNSKTLLFVSHENIFLDNLKVIDI